MKMNREELKRLFLTFPTVDRPVTKKIIITMMTNKFHWIGYGNVAIKRDGPDGFSQFKTHQEYPYTYVVGRKEFIDGNYELIIKE